jgi:hypothetical protein
MPINVVVIFANKINTFFILFLTNQWPTALFLNNPFYQLNIFFEEIYSILLPASLIQLFFLENMIY